MTCRSCILSINCYLVGQQTWSTNLWFTLIAIFELKGSSDVSVSLMALRPRHCMHSRNREELAMRCLLPRLWVLAGLKAAGHER